MMGKMEPGRAEGGLLMMSLLTLVYKYIVFIKCIIMSDRGRV